MTKPKRNLKTASLSPKAKEVEAAADSIPTPESGSTPTPPPAEKAQKIISPLLSESVEIKAHAMGIGPGAQNGQPSPTPANSFEVEGDFWSTKSYIDPKTAAANATPTDPAQPGAQPGSSPTAPPLQPQMPQMPVDVPEQKFTEGTPGMVDTNPLVDQAAIQAASDMVDTIMEMYKRGVPEITHDKIKIKSKDIKEIKSLENKGEVLVGVSEEFIILNKENKKRLEERAASDAILMKKPLKKWLGTKNIPIPPYVEFIVVLVFIGITYFFLVREMKSSNDALLEKIYENIRKKKEAEIQTVVAEEVK